MDTHARLGAAVGEPHAEHEDARVEDAARIEELLRREADRNRAWLHDTVLQVLEYLASGGYGSCTEPERLMQVAADAADDLRRTIDDEDDHHEPVDFAGAVRDVVDEARRLSGLDVRLDLRRMRHAVDPQVGAEVAEVVREALNNARKHAHAQTVRVACETGGGLLEVRVVDDGRGFDPRAVREGLGMRRSMRQRMERCGGSVAIASAPGRGVLVRICADAGRRAARQETVA